MPTFLIVSSLIAEIALGFTATTEIIFSALLPFLSRALTVISCLLTEPSVPVIVFLAES